jgi:hypothetical protein
MRHRLVVVMLAAAPACTPRRELEQVEATLKAHVAAQEHAVATMSTYRASALRAELLAVDAGFLTGIAQHGEPTMLVTVPEKSFFEGATEAKLRARIAMLQAESEQLDRVMTELSDMDARKQRAEAQLRQLEAMQADGGTQ